VPSAAKSAVAPLYLFACLLLGGSAQGLWQNALLQLVGIVIISWTALAPRDELFPTTARPLAWLVLLGIVVVALQNLPVPPAIWAQGERARIADDFRLLNVAPPWMPLSLTPEASLSTLLCLIPSIAMFCAIVSLGGCRPSWLAAALLSAAVLSVMLGALQVAVPELRSPWYLYRQTNRGLAVGFFANANHMADQLVITLPFVAAIAAAGRGRNIQRYSALVAILGGASLVLIVGIGLNRSLAGYTLVVPVLAGSALLLLPRASGLRLWLGAAVALSVVAAVAAMASSSISSARIGQDAIGSVQSREQILKTTLEAIDDYLPFGSGLGSFVKVYRLYESPDAVTTEYVIHAHDDYAELALELGLPGIVLMAALLAWWAGAAWTVWRRSEGSPYTRAASIASAAILIHSTVDFPLRTAAISAVFAMCLALLADRRLPARREANDLRPTRHLVVG
jgi:O-antigen ligase